MMRESDLEKIKQKTVQIIIPNKQIVEANDVFETHRELVTYRFKQAGYVVINWLELKYLYQPTCVVVEGINGQSVLKM